MKPVLLLQIIMFLLLPRAAMAVDDPSIYEDLRSFTGEFNLSSGDKGCAATMHSVLTQEDAGVQIQVTGQNGFSWFNYTPTGAGTSSATGQAVFRFQAINAGQQVKDIADRDQNTVQERSNAEFSGNRLIQTLSVPFHSTTALIIGASVGISLPPACKGCPQISSSTSEVYEQPRAVKRNAPEVSKQIALVRTDDDYFELSYRESPRWEDQTAKVMGYSILMVFDPRNWVNSYGGGFTCTYQRNATD